MGNEETIKSELDFVYETTLSRALHLGWSLQRAEDFARSAVVDYFLNAK